MITLGDIKGTIEKLKENDNMDLEETYKCIFSIFNEYLKNNKEFISEKSESYQLLKAFFGNNYDIINCIKENNDISFPLYMESLDSKIVTNFIETFIMYFIGDKEFVQKMIEKYETYNFTNDYKNKMLDFIDEKFKKIIGLKNIKEDLKDLVILITNNKIREQNNLNKTSISMHMVFTGNPGTGKTTIARLIGEMYYKLGIIKNNNFVEVSRVDLVAEYVGQTAVKTTKVLESAKGGVLFIDEAYSLAVSTENDYGKEAIETILKFMEDNRENTIIIVAGYEQEMSKFINSNPGLKSRFNKFFKFNNYDSDELYQIFKVFTEDNNYTINRIDEQMIKNKFNEIDTNTSNFSNARYVRNLYDKTILNQAKRIDTNNITDKEEFITIKSEDIEI